MEIWWLNKTYHWHWISSFDFSVDSCVKLFFDKMSFTTF